MSIAHLFPDLHPAFAPQEALVESNRCLFCYDAPCTAACPTHIDVPRFIKKISTANLRGSALTILDANLLGSSCSRVCPVDVLCEGACVMHRYNREPIQIGRLQRHAMEAFYRSGDTQLPELLSPPRQLRVACIGAGPASLSCAGELARRGHLVTVFESRPLPGGLNTYGVAEYKLRMPDAIREAAFIESLGVEIRCNENVDKDRLRQIEAEHDAVFLGLGLGRMDPLGIPGDDHFSVMDALRFIAGYKTSIPDPIPAGRQPIEIVEIMEDGGYMTVDSVGTGRRVVVIGAGNTAIDAANAARRLGAAEVTMLYRRTAADMSAFTFEYDHARHEGVEFRWLVKPVRVISENGKLTGLECLRISTSETFTIPCDLIIPAIGQSKNSDLLASVAGNPKFFAGGDLTNGGREVVDAVADGKRAALAIIERFGTHA
jgi:dihydropyrimidine dehydrogenase (NAD+) subunit PreT